MGDGIARPDRFAVGLRPGLPLTQALLARPLVREEEKTLADDIARRGLLQSLSVRPLLDAEGPESGRYEIPTGGRRFITIAFLPFKAVQLAAWLAFHRPAGNVISNRE